MPFIVMMGPQGAGKGTQADKLAIKINTPHVSMGTMLRSEVNAGTEIGRQIEDILKRGDLVPIDVTERLLEKRLAAGAGDGVILDGYPRDAGQIEQLRRVLERLGKRLDHAILLNISDEEALRRLAGRRVCSNPECELNYHMEHNPPKEPDKCDRCGSDIVQRKDDQPEAIKRRLELYHKETKPLADIYRKWGILRKIDGMRPIAEVEKSICEIACPVKGGCNC